MLSERISTWRPIRSGRKNWQARQTASISKQLMWKPFSAFDQWPKVGLPSHSAPQPVLEASVVTTFLLWTNPMATPFFIHRGFFQGVRAVTQACFTLICRRPWRHALCGTRGFNQRWRGACGAGPAVTLAMLRPWGPAFSETLWVGERCRSWRWPRVSEWPERVLALSPLSCELSPELYPGTILVGWETVRFWRNWPWAPGALSGWGWGFCVKVVPPLTGPEWASRRGSWECGFPSVSEGKEPRPCTS